MNGRRPRVGRPKTSMSTVAFQWPDPWSLARAATWVVCCLAASAAAAHILGRFGPRFRPARPVLAWGASVIGLAVVVVMAWKAINMFRTPTDLLVRSGGVGDWTALLGAFFLMAIAHARRRPPVERIAIQPDSGPIRAVDWRSERSDRKAA